MDHHYNFYNLGNRSLEEHYLVILVLGTGLCSFHYSRAWYLTGTVFQSQENFHFIRQLIILFNLVIIKIFKFYCHQFCISIPYKHCHLELVFICEKYRTLCTLKSILCAILISMHQLKISITSIILKLTGLVYFRGFSCLLVLVDFFSLVSGGHHGQILLSKIKKMNVCY